MSRTLLRGPFAENRQALQSGQINGKGATPASDGNAHFFDDWMLAALLAAQELLWPGTCVFAPRTSSIAPAICGQ